MRVKKGFGCHRRGHAAMDGWDSTPQQNQAGHWFAPRVCRDCHCPYIEFLGSQEVASVVTAMGQRIIMDGRED